MTSTITLVRAIRSASLSVIILALAQGAGAAPESLAGVGKYRSCQPVVDCRQHIRACPVEIDGGECKREIELFFGLKIVTNDPNCEATKQARAAARLNCETIKAASILECETFNKQARLCAELRVSEITKCENDLHEFVRLENRMRDGWWHSRIPRKIQIFLEDSFSAERMKEALVTDKLRALAPKQFVVDAVQSQGWLTTGNIIILPRIPSSVDVCAWIHILASAEIAENLGADGYCQVLQAQPSFLIEAVENRSKEIANRKRIKCGV
jgi:hypothetical protein